LVGLDLWLNGGSELIQLESCVFDVVFMLSYKIDFKNPSENHMYPPKVPLPTTTCIYFIVCF